MAHKLIATLEGIEVFQDLNGRVHWTGGGMDIDADGANGETRHPVNGKRLYAYGPENTGLDDNRNAGYPHGDYQEILVCDARGNPILQEGGGWYSRTAYSRGALWPEKLRWLDSCSVPYVVVSPVIRRRARGIVLGCRARVTYFGLSVDAVVGDVGPEKKIGEGSIALAEALGIDPDARVGGTDSNDIIFELWPDQVAVLNGERFDLKPMGHASTMMRKERI